MSILDYIIPSRRQKRTKEREAHQQAERTLFDNLYYLNWQEFCEWIQGKVLANTSTCACHIETDYTNDVDSFWCSDNEYKDYIKLTFTDGSICVFRSQFDRGYSEETPGDGIQPPEVYVWQP